MPSMSYKFYSNKSTVYNSFKNSFEADYTSGRSNASSVIQTVSKDDIESDSFYKNRPRFNSNIWNYSNINKYCYPEIKGLNKYNKEVTTKAK